MKCYWCNKEDNTAILRHFNFVNLGPICNTCCEHPRFKQDENILPFEQTKKE